jgi:hypothetical protein
MSPKRLGVNRIRLPDLVAAPWAMMKFWRITVFG